MAVRAKRKPTNGDEMAALRNNVALLAEQLAEAERMRQPFGIAGSLQESLVELELSMEDRKWLMMSRVGQELSRQQLGDIWRLSLLMYLANPLINRAVNLQSYYVWGQGITIRAKSPLVNEIVQAFLDDKKNQTELTSHQSRTLKEVDLQVYGNLFFVLFTDTEGAVRLRTIPCVEVADILTNPEDRKDSWYYKRQWQQSALDVSSGTTIPQQRTAYYPDWRYRPEVGKPPIIGGSAVEWDTPCYHVKVGGMSDMLFGVPETYQAIDWARAYNKFLEDVATLMRAYARFAMAITTPGNAATQAVLGMLGTTLGATGTLGETNPPPVTGSTFVGTGDYKLAPVRTAGATTGAEEGRRFLLQVCAATGLPECYSEDTEVLTERGFMSHMAWRPGIRVACFDSESRRISWQHPLGLNVHYYRGDMIHFCNQQTDILVTPNHRMWVAPEVQWKLLPATGRVAVGVYGPGGRQRIADGAPARVDRSWRIETAEHVAANPRDAGWKFSNAVHFAEPESMPNMPTPIGSVDAVAWARFIGYWISEGSAPSSVCKSGEFRKDGIPIMRTFRRILLSQRDGSVLDDMKQVLHILGLHFGESTVTGGVKNLIIWNKSLWGWLRSECGENSHVKHIPRSLLEVSADVRRALFEALMAGDGGRVGSSWRYSTVSKRLADDMQLLAISLGYGASITTESRLYNGSPHPIYRVWIRTRITSISHISPRHVGHVDYDGLVYCFAVPTGIYVTRRNGHVAVQGNSFFGDVSVGTLATAKSLDRPTELKFVDRRTLWADVWHDILAYVVKAALEAGKLPAIDPDTGEDIDTTVDISFPPILEHSVTESVAAIVQAATLDGKAVAGTIPDTKTLSRMLLTALGVPEVDEALETLFPEDEETAPPVEAMTEALREVRAVLVKMQEG